MPLLIEAPLTLTSLYLGVGCAQNRTLSRVYFIKALSARNATDTLKATVHGLLIDWYVSVSKDPLRPRYLYAACHHANISARMGRLISPKGAPASPAILNFMNKMFKPLGERVPDLYYLYEDAVRALEDRVEQMRVDRENLHVKRISQPNRYRCATPGCGIEADSGSMLSKCAFPTFYFRFTCLNPVCQVADLATSIRNPTIAARNAKRLIGRTTNGFVILGRSVPSSILEIPMSWRALVRSRNLELCVFPCSWKTDRRDI